MQRWKWGRRWYEENTPTDDEQGKKWEGRICSTKANVIINWYEFSLNNGLLYYPHKICIKHTNNSLTESFHVLGKTTGTWAMLSVMMLTSAHCFFSCSLFLRFLGISKLAGTPLVCLSAKMLHSPGTVRKILQHYRPISVTLSSAQLLLELTGKKKAWDWKRNMTKLGKTVKVCISEQKQLQKLTPLPSSRLLLLTWENNILEAQVDIRRKWSSSHIF